MTWLAQLFRPKTALPETVVRAVDSWRALPQTPESTPIDAVRFVVVDVETTGLNVRRDRLLSIGAVTVERLHLKPGAAFNAVLQNGVPSTRENVLVHGLTPSRQAAGDTRDQALGRFLEFVGKAPCVAFHATFDRAVLNRALNAELGTRLPNPWLDLARLAPALFPRARLSHATLDDWLAHFRIHVHRRHDAIYDAHCTAELLLIVLARARRRGISTLAQLRATEHAYQDHYRG